MQYKNVQIGLEKSEREWTALLASPDALEVIVVTDSLTDLLSVSTDLTDVTSVVKADFLKAVRKAVSKRFIRLFNEVNRMNDCFEMRKTSVRLRTLTLSRLAP